MCPQQRRFHSCPQALSRNMGRLVLSPATCSALANLAQYFASTYLRLLIYSYSEFQHRAQTAFVRYRFGPLPLRHITLRHKSVVHIDALQVSVR